MASSGLSPSMTDKLRGGFVCPRCGGNGYGTRNVMDDPKLWVRMCTSPECGFEWPIADDRRYIRDEPRRFMEWVNGNDRQPTPDDEPFDVWVKTIDPETAKVSGFRITNCWLHNGSCLHSIGSGLPPEIVNGATHWVRITPPEAD